ncbi:MAG: hypothetical protein ACP5OR_08885 [Candidatus Dormibacteria bacterium]
MSTSSLNKIRQLFTQNARHPEKDVLKGLREAAYSPTFPWEILRKGSMTEVSYLLENMAQHCSTTKELCIILDLFDSVPRTRFESWCTEKAGSVLVDRANGVSRFGALPEGWQEAIPSHIRGQSSGYWGKSMLRAAYILEGKPIGGLLGKEDRGLD